MSVVKAYRPLDEQDLDMVMYLTQWSKNIRPCWSFSALLDRPVSTLILLFFSPPRDHEMILRVAGQEGARDLPTILGYQPVEAINKFELSSVEYRHLLEAIAQLHFADYSKRKVYVYRQIRWRTEVVELPSEQGVTVYQRLSQLAQDAVGHELDYLFLYERPMPSLEPCEVPYDVFLQNSYPMCAQLLERPATELAHYSHGSDIRELVDEIAEDPERQTIGALVTYTSTELMQWFGMNDYELESVLAALSNLEAALRLLAELELTRRERSELA